MDDMEFVQRCIKKDAATWDEFYEKYSRLIYQYIHSTLKIKGYHFTPDHVREIFHDLFCLLFKDNCRKLATYRGLNGCTLASWLRQVTVNFTLSYLRRIRPQMSLEEEVEEDLTLKDILADASKSVPDKLHDKEKLKVLEECVQRLGGHDQFFLELYLNRGFRLEELKGMLELSRGALDMQKSRIMEKLRECFQQKGFRVF
jgi:RNA polymerase sigma factor (sigma-70 family)